MREIKFRALRKDQHFKGWLYWEVTDGFSAPRNTIDITTICQFTGLTDKSGVEIYEGDILEKRKKPKQETLNIGEVKFVESMGCYSIGGEFGSQVMWAYKDGMTEGKVIGNIHENKELLK